MSEQFDHATLVEAVGKLLDSSQMPPTDDMYLVVSPGVAQVLRQGFGIKSGCTMIAPFPNPQWRVTFFGRPDLSCTFTDRQEAQNYTDAITALEDM